MSWLSRKHETAEVIKYSKLAGEQLIMLALIALMQGSGIGTPELEDELTKRALSWRY